MHVQDIAVSVSCSGLGSSFYRLAQDGGTYIVYVCIRRVSRRVTRWGCNNKGNKKGRDVGKGLQEWDGEIRMLFYFLFF